MIKIKEKYIFYIILLVTSITITICVLYILHNRTHNKTYPTKKKPNPTKCEKPDGIDISHHNKPYDWSKISVDFVYIRATMGSTIKDKMYVVHKDSAAKYNIPIGAYHFLTAKTTVEEQFNNFSSVVKKQHLQLRPMLDIEESKYWGAPKGFTEKKAHRFIRKWCDLCVSEYGTAPIIYTTETLYKRYGLEEDFEDCIWWVANYNTINDYEQKCIIPYTLHQYSDKKLVEGFWGYVDCNRFAPNKNVNDLRIIIHE